MCEYIGTYKIYVIRFANEQNLGLYRKSFSNSNSGKHLKH